VRAILGEVSWAIAHTKDNYLSAFYHRIARRRGKQKAIMALSHKVLVILYHVLRDKRPYTDLGAEYFDKLDTTRIQRHHVRRLEQLGFTVTLTPKESETAYPGLWRASTLFQDRALSCQLRGADGGKQYTGETLKVCVRLWQHETVKLLSSP
jgi:hypothetical protein